MAFSLKHFSMRHFSMFKTFEPIGGGGASGQYIIWMRRRYR